MIKITTTLTNTPKSHKYKLTQIFNTLNVS